MTTPTRILLVEDHASLRDALATVLELTDDMVVAAQIDVADPDALDLIVGMAAQIDVAVVDLDLPGGSGVEVIRRLRGVAHAPACMVLTGLRDDLELGLAIEAGAVAVLHKSASMPDLLEAIRVVAAGGSVLPADETSRRLKAVATDRARGRRSRLIAERITPRELEILEHLVYGLDGQTIADRLHISNETVKTHTKNLLGKLGASSRLEAVSLALQHGLIDPP